VEQATPNGVSVDDFEVEGNTPEPPQAQTPATPPAASVAAIEDADDASPVPVDAQPDESKPEGKRNSIQARIDKSVAAQRQAERERDELRMRLEHLERQVSQPRQEPTRQEQTPAQPRYFTAPPPSEDEIGTKYKDYPEFIRATAQWQVAEARAEDAMQARYRAVQERHSATAQKFSSKIAEAEQGDPDYWSKVDPAVANLQPSTALEPGQRPTALNAIADIIFDSDYSTELMARLRASDLQRLSTLPPAQLYREMGRLEASVMRPGAATPGPAPRTPAVSQAPPPIKPVGTSASTGDVDPFAQDLDVDEHIRVMNARDKKGRFTSR
jgi:hypothetical protein